MKDLKELVRPNIWTLEPYSCARTEFTGKGASVFLDANENPYNNPTNRYPDPFQTELKEKLSALKGVPAGNMFLGNGSDEAIDLVYRIFCRPGVDNVVAMSPTYGMYQVCADINDVEYRPVQLNDDFTLDADRLLAATDDRTKAIFICSPNNPTGNAMARSEVEKVLNTFPGIVVLDEAYSDFSSQRVFRHDIEQWPNMIVLNTMSKAWASAAIRLGMAFASTDIIGLMNKVKYPYNVSLPNQQRALDVLAQRVKVADWVRAILRERPLLMEAFSQLPVCKKVYPTDANFFLARMTDATAIYNYLTEKGIVVRNRTNVTLCHNCLRITIGLPQENSALLGALRTYRP